jgi:F420H(2)-dependent quinone reductase
VRLLVMESVMASGFGRYVFRQLVALQVWLYRRSGGVLAMRPRRMRVLLLTTVGRRSGKPRTVPLLHVRDGDGYVLAGSNNGSDRHPAWVLNLRTNSHAQVQVGRQVFEVVAREAGPQERERLWQLMVDGKSSYGAYQQKTKRRIPIVVLEPVGPAASTG